MAKHQVKRLRLNKILRSQEVDLAELIEDSFARIDQNGVRNCIKKSLKLLQLEE